MININRCIEGSFTNPKNSKIQTFQSDTRAWRYQTCTEFGFFQTTDQTDHPFGKHLPLDYFIKQCQDKFSHTITRDTIENAVAETNKYYGSLNDTITKVVFVNGSNDPWHPLSVLRNLNPTTVALVINGVSHCADMSSWPNNPEIIKAQARIKKIIESFL